MLGGFTLVDSPKSPRPEQFLPQQRRRPQRQSWHRLDTTLQIPDPELTWLDLNDNDLSGPIPSLGESNLEQYLQDH